MERIALIPSIMQQRAEHGPIKIYIGRNDRTKYADIPSIHYTDDHEEGPYFYGPEGGFQILYPHARPIGVIGPDDKEIFWSDPEEAALELKEDLAKKK